MPRAIYEWRKREKFLRKIIGKQLELMRIFMKKKKRAVIRDQTSVLVTYDNCQRSFDVLHALAFKRQC